MGDRPQPQLSVGLRSFAPDDPGGWQQLLDQARVLDAAGVDRLAVSDHVVFGEHMEEYGRPEVGGQAGGKQPTGPDGHWLEPLTTLAVLAGTTSRIRLATGILIAALRRPVVLAKVAATLDVLSGGRLDLGVGVGWQREEYEAAGLDFDTRGRLLDHTLSVCRTLWRERRAGFESPELTFEAIHMMPKPLQEDGVPIWVSGTVNPRVVRRVARFGSGWIPWGDASVDVATGIARMREALGELGRDPSGLQVVGNLARVRNDDGGLDLERTMGAVPELVESGVTDFRLAVAIPSDQSQALEKLSRIVEAFRAVTGPSGG
jgi:probable F420-dependent oxidoreductase